MIYTYYKTRYVECDFCGDVIIIEAPSAMPRHAAYAMKCHGWYPVHSQNKDGWVHLCPDCIDVLEGVRLFDDGYIQWHSDYVLDERDIRISDW